MRQAEAGALRKKKATLESYNRLKCSSSSTSFKTSGQTTSANAFPKRTGQANRSFVPLSSSKNNRQADRLTSALDVASKVTGGNTAVHNVGKETTQKATNSEVKYDKNIHFVVPGDFVDTDGKNVECEEGHNKQSVKSRFKYSTEIWKNTLKADDFVI